jgi:hypothetical protein
MPVPDEGHQKEQDNRKNPPPAAFFLHDWLNHTAPILFLRLLHIEVSSRFVAARGRQRVAIA